MLSKESQLRDIIPREHPVPPGLQLSSSAHKKPQAPGKACSRVPVHIQVSCRSIEAPKETRSDEPQSLAQQHFPRSESKSGLRACT